MKKPEFLHNVDHSVLKLSLETGSEEKAGGDYGQVVVMLRDDPGCMKACRGCRSVDKKNGYVLRVMVREGTFEVTGNGC